VPKSAKGQFAGFDLNISHRSRRSIDGILLLLPIIAILSATEAYAQASAKPRPSMQASELTQSPSVDGNVLGDAAWDGVSPATGFWQIRPDDDQPATQRTEVYIGFTDESLFIGVVAYDDSPSEIIVTDSRRDSSLEESDAFLVIIDGLLDKQNGYIFGTNAASVEYDAQVTKEGSGQFSFGGGGFNLNWDGTWTVKSKITDIGWTTEFEIPFRTLRYGSQDVQTWGINFQRNIRRNNEVVFWAPLERNRSINRVSEAGTIERVGPPPQKNFKITPYVLGRTRDGGELDDRENNSEFGFDFKYSITPSLTLDGTYNTDFAQVEVDEVQFNLDRFNLFFPEKRPFFLENAGQFTVGNAAEAQLFFSRRIGISEDGDPIPVEGGLRMSGKIGDSTNLGLLYMSTEGVEGFAPENQFAVVRVYQELPNRSTIGAIYVGREGDGSFLLPEDQDSNRTYGLDGRLGIGDNLIIDAWLAKTETPGLTGRDDAFSAKANYSSPKWSYRFEYTEIGEDFNPEVGFLTRSNYRKVGGFAMRRIRPADLWNLMEIRPHISYNGYWTFDGFQETGFLHVDSHWEFKSSNEIHTGMNFKKEGVIDPFEIVDGVFIPAGTYDESEVQIIGFTDQSKPLSFSMRVTVGGSFGGDRVSLAPSIHYRIGESFSSEFSVRYNDFDIPVPNGEFQANLARLRLSYSFTPKILLQTLVQYNELDEELSANLRFSWLNSANSGLYIVYNQFDERGVGGLPTGQELIIKYSYIFDVFK
jgi:hypothetical protein